jgi:hypothetical protein
MKFLFWTEEVDVKLRIFVMLGVVFGLVSTILAQQAPVPEPVTAIRAGYVIDVENGRELEKQIILLRGKRIEAIGSDLKIPVGAKILDLSGKTVLPVLIATRTWQMARTTRAGILHHN